MSAAAPSLRRLQQVFRDLGINDDVQIAGSCGLLVARARSVGRIAEDETTSISSLDWMTSCETCDKNTLDLRHIPEPPMIRQATRGCCGP